MLTIRKIRIASGDLANARRAARYWLEPDDAPQAFADADHQAGRSTRWSGSTLMLDTLGVGRGEALRRDELALALQGRNVMTGERVRREGRLQILAVDEDGLRRKVATLGTKSVDLTFSAPKSVSVLWSQATPALRAPIEVAMLDAAEAMVACMTQTKPVVKHHGQLVAGTGFAAGVVLHVKARAAKGDSVPSPQLHAHAVVVGVEREDGFFASPELSGMFKSGAPLEGGALARVRLAETLVDLGLPIASETGRGGRFFEVDAVPRGLIERMSGRTRDVEEKIREREAVRDSPLSNDERAVAAMQTRAPKRVEASPRDSAAVWRAHASDFDFDATTVEAMRTGRGFGGSDAQRGRAVRAAAQRRLAARQMLPAEARAAVLECAAGRLRLSEAHALLDDMEGAGELSPRT